MSPILEELPTIKNACNEYTVADWVINLDGDDYFTNTQFISQAMHAIKKPE